MTSKPLSDQLNARLLLIKQKINSGIHIDGIAARGGPLKPLMGGTYSINDNMLTDYRHKTFSSHASNLGALMAHELSNLSGAPAFIVDPVTTDEFIPEARISGVPGIERKSRSHALNIKYCVRKTAKSLNISIHKSRFIVAHLGSGFSIAAVRHCKIIDVNDALLGMGPFSIERAGALPIAGLLDLIFIENKTRKEWEYLFSKKSGLAGYVGTSDFKQIESQLNDPKVQTIYSAMVHQIIKEMGAMFAVLEGKIDGLILTGGLAHSEQLMTDISSKISFANPVFVYPGSFELKALIEGVLPIISGNEKPKDYI